LPTPRDLICDQSHKLGWQRRKFFRVCSLWLSKYFFKFPFSVGYYRILWSDARNLRHFATLKVLQQLKDEKFQSDALDDELKAFLFIQLDSRDFGLKHFTPRISGAHSRTKTNVMIRAG
jgi:hypothetical protein